MDKPHKHKLVKTTKKVTLVAGRKTAVDTLKQLVCTEKLDKQPCPFRVTYDLERSIK